MPDGRLRDGKGLSTHPPTVRIRNRLANLPPAERAAHQARSRECSAIWSACHRVSKSETYKRTTVGHRRAILLQYITNLFERRKKKGKDRVGVSEEAIVDKHLKKEAVERKFAQMRNNEANNISLRGIPVEPPSDEEDSQVGDADEEGVEGDDDEPLPFKMILNDPADGAQHGQVSYTELRLRRMEHKNDRMEQKIDQILNFLTMRQRGNHASMMPPLSFTRPSSMSAPNMSMMFMDNHHRPNGDLPTPDDCFDEGYVSASQQSPHPQQGDFPTGFDLYEREQAAAAQSHQQNGQWVGQTLSLEGLMPHQTQAGLEPQQDRTVPFLSDNMRNAISTANKAGTRGTSDHNHTQA